MPKDKKTDQNILKDAGYRESANKPNLFYKPLSTGAVFADMRGHGQILVWVHSKNPGWWNVRIANRAFRKLRTEHFSSYLINTLEGYDNGYCRICGKDFQDNGLYCSDECKKIADENKRIAFYKQFIITYNPDKNKYLFLCQVCGKIIGSNPYENHHISYYPQASIPVHCKCHQKIHHTDLYTHLKPPNGDGKDFYNNVEKPDNWIISGIAGMELKVTRSAIASCYPKPNLNWNRAAKTEINIKYDLVYRKKVTKPRT